MRPCHALGLSAAALVWIAGCGGDEPADASTTGGAGAGHASGGTGGHASGTQSTGSISTGTGLPVPDCGDVTATGEPGAWVNVTPPEMVLDASHEWDWGVSHLLIDPVRPNDVYAFGNSSPTGSLWKSSDYGETWTLVSDDLGGGPWSAALDPDPDRDPRTPPKFHVTFSFGGGFHQSTDGGLTWVERTVGAMNNDACEIEVNPYDRRHIVVGSHSDGDLYESHDGGETWINQGDVGDGAFNPNFTFLGPDVLLATFDGDQGPGPGTWRGVRSGSTWPWTWSWTRVSDQQRFHGSHQVYVDPKDNVIFNGGAFGIEKSTDVGLGWTSVASELSGVVIGTPSALYSSTNYASKGGFAPRLQRSDTKGERWVADPTPEGMSNGAHSAVVTCDGSHHILLTGNWLAGIWRYVEP
jgi:hypothetical protein